MRDLLLGLTVVRADGTVVKGGGRVVKNVTGYDIPKLHVGALGTLGVVVEAHLRLHARPARGAELGVRLRERRGRARGRPRGPRDVRSC